MNRINFLKSSQWLALVIGNSHLHWAYFQGDSLQRTWNTFHLSDPLITPNLPQDLLLPEVSNDLPLYLSSVVPSQTQLWLAYPKNNLITLEQISLHKVYPTMGIDRALAILGAGERYGFPCLVIDAGTALTLTGVDGDRTLVGGAILPGLNLQFQALATKTAALPKVELPDILPPRWATTTPDAIASGIIYTVLAGIKAFIESWLSQFPSSQIILTGGDSTHLWRYLQGQYPEISTYLKEDKNVIFWGMRSLLF